MRRIERIGLVAAVGLVAFACAEGPDMQSFTEKSSYAIGLDVGKSVQRTGAEIHYPSLVRGIEDVLRERDLALTDEEADQVMRELAARLEEGSKERMDAASEENISAGNAYRADNGARDGVVTTESGLQYEVLVVGPGPRPTASDRVTVHYTGTLIDGTEFDSSRKRGEPVTFPVGGVIPGWIEGLQLMPVGSTYRFVISPELGYGERGSPPRIGPNATLVFEVELIEIPE